MAFNAFVDAFNIGTGAATSTVVRTGYGFQPKACIYFWSGTTSATDASGALDLRAGIGVACSATDRRALTIYAGTGLATAVAGTRHTNIECIEAIASDNSVDGNADLQSFDSDGQTLVIDTQFVTNLRVHALALGGSHLLNAQTFDFFAPVTAGTADVTSLGFQPDAVLLFCSNLITAPPNVTNSAAMTIGLVTSATAQSAVAWHLRNGVSPTIARRYAQQGECLAGFPASAGPPNMRAAFVEFLANGFRLNWLESTSGRCIHGLALQGPNCFAVGELLTQTNTSTPIGVTGLGFPAAGAFFVAHQAAESTVDTEQLGAQASLGATAGATNRGSHGWVVTHNASTTACTARVEHDGVYAAYADNDGTTLAGVMDLQSLDADGLTAIMDVADPAPRLVTFLAFGEGQRVVNLTANLQGASRTSAPRATGAASTVAAGITVLWSGTAASIPSGWTRATALDGRYPRGAATNTEPGATGGATTHTHTTAAHDHTTAHTHPVPNTTGTTGSSARDSGTTNPPAAHTHVNPATVNPTTALATETPAWDTVSHEPPFSTVLFLASDGTPLGLPPSTIALWNDPASTPTSWNLCDGASGRPDLRGRYLKGANTGADGGGTGGGTTHSHALPSHSHGAIYAHGHPNVTSGTPAEAMVAGTVSGAQVAVATATHTHALTIGSASPAVTGQADSASSSAHEPPYWVLAYIQNNAGALSWPDRVIALWTGSLATIPGDWVLCDGTNETPDLRSLFIKGATTLAGIGASGGSATHTHTVTGHTHAVASHTHTVTGAAGASEQRTAGAVNAPTDAHTHTWPATGGTAFTSGSATPTLDALATSAPPYTDVVFLEWQPPAPSGPTTRDLTASLLGSSTTPPVILPTARPLSAALSGDSTTPASLASLLRTLLSTLAGASVTPDAVAQLITVRNLTAQASGVSTTPDSAVTTVRSLSSALTGVSTTAEALGTTLRPLAATVTASSTTPDSLAGQIRLLASTLLGASLTPEALVSLLTVRALTASGLGASTTPASAVLLARDLPSRCTGGSQTPAVLSTLLRALTGALTGASRTADVTAALTAVRLLTASLLGRSLTPPVLPDVLVSPVNFSMPFSVAAGASWTIPHATHGFGHPYLRVQVYDDATPRQRLRPGPISIHPTSFLITIPFLQTQSGLVVVNGGTLDTPELANKGYPFTAATAVVPFVLPGSTHNFSTANLLIDVYDDSTPRVLLPDIDVTVDPTTFDITIRPLQAQSGLVVVCGASGLTPVNSGIAFTNATDAAPAVVLGSTHGRNTANLGVQLYDAAGVEVQGVVTVHPSTFDVTVRFLTPQSGTVVLNGVVVSGVRELTAALHATSTTPDSLVTSVRLLSSTLAGVSLTSDAAVQVATLRALTASPLGASVTPLALVTIERAFRALVPGTSSTPSSGVALARVLPATISGASTTPTSTSSLARALTATLAGTSSTPTSGVVISRTLTASAAGVSTTPLSVMTTTRRLLAMLTGTSTTRQATAFLTAVRAFTASLTGPSVTPSSASLQTRTLTGALAGASTTPAAATVLAQVRLLAATLAGSSTTPLGTVTQQRTVRSEILAASLTSAADATTQRPLVSALAGSSSTEAAAVFLTAVRALTGTLGAVSVTPASTVTQQRGLSTQVVGVSQTPAAGATTHRPFASRVEGTSVTRAPAVYLTAVRALTASLTASSTTPVVPASLQRALSAQALGTSLTAVAPVTMQRPLLTALVGVSSTPLVIVTTQRPLAALLVGSSVTPASGTGILRALVGRATGVSTTQAASAVVTGLRALAASLLGPSATLPSGVFQGRQLVAVLLGASSTPPALTVVHRPLTAALLAQSTTPSGLLINTAFLQARLQGHSITPPRAVVTMARTFVASAPGLSTTPPALIHHLRVLQSALAGGSLTPGTQGLLVRQVVSLLTARSDTALSTYTLARDLVALLTGTTLTSASLVTTVRPLDAALVGASVTPVSLFVPNSGEMALRAAVVGVSLTTGGRFLLLPMQRVTLVPFAPRGATPDGKERVGVARPSSRTTTVS